MESVFYLKLQGSELEVLITAIAAVTMVTGAVVCRQQASFCSVLFFFKPTLLQTRVIKAIPRVWRATYSVFRIPAVVRSKANSSCCL